VLVLAAWHLGMLAAGCWLLAAGCCLAGWAGRLPLGALVL